MSEPIIIPSRFESLVESQQVKAQPTLVPVELDIRAFDYLVEKARLQNGGVLAFLLGSTGVGKSTAAFAATVYLSDKIGGFILVPSEIDLREAATWLNKNVPEIPSKVTLVLFDGREVTDDEVGLKQFLTSLNQFLRKRKDVIFLWPTTDEGWHDEIRSLAKTIGGSNFVPADSDIMVMGPDKAEWIKILERILIQLDTTLSEVALDQLFLEQTIKASPTIGEFLSEVGNAIALRTSRLRKIKGLPNLMFVVTSGPEVVGESNRIRRAGTHILKAEELLAYSPRSEAGKWWKAKLQTPEYHLAYVISLFNARLATMTASSVAYASLHHGSSLISTAAATAGMTRHTTNASTTLQATDLYRMLLGQTIAELTSSRKGAVKDTTTAAFAAVQALSAKHHRQINESVVKALAEEIDVIDLARTKFEVDGGDQNLYTDVILARTSDEVFLEFHHLSEANCGAASMAAYIMDKLRAYAIHFNLIPR